MSTTTLEGIFPWIRWLPAEDQEAFASELRQRSDEACRVIAEWRNTASIYEDPELLAALTAPIEL